MILAIIFHVIDFELQTVRIFEDRSFEGGSVIHCDILGLTLEHAILSMQHEARR